MIKRIYDADVDKNIVTLSGLSTDTKPTSEWDGVTLNAGSEFRELNTGIVWEFDGQGGWHWSYSLKELDHNRTMIGLGLSYKTWHKNTVTSNLHAVYRFNPNNVSFHHAEKRTWRGKGGDMNFRIYRNHNIANFPGYPTPVLSLPIVNQNGLDPSLQNSPLIFDFYGNITDAQLATLLSGAVQVDADELFIPSGVGNSINTAQSSLPSGRHYDADTEYLVVQDPDNGDDITYFYAYTWHDKPNS